MRPPPFPIRADLAHKRATQKRRRLRAALAVSLGVILTLGLIGLWLWRWALADLPPVPDAASLWALNRPPAMRFIDRDGGTIGTRGGLGQKIDLPSLPPYVPRAFLAAEDHRFYRHHGVDLEGLARAAVADLRARRVVQGASTITQQLARNLFLNPQQTFRRKVQEAALAVMIERRLKKDDVLALYLDRIYFGGGAYGLEAASQTYFAKPAKQLTLSEAALLAALPKAPSRYAKTDLDAALPRSRGVLHDMREEGWITEKQEAEAAAAPPRLAPPSPTEDDFGYVLDLAAQRARELTRGAPPADLMVRLTIDPRLQKEAAAAVRDAVAKGKAQGATQAALVAMAPGGAVRALVGGVDHRASPFDRATDALRQPGSAFKPFVYATALEAGMSPSDVRLDAPVRFGDWSPKNFGGTFAGQVTLADAFARSINTVAARLTNEVGPDKVAELAHRFGLANIPDHPALPVALGAYEVSLFDLVSAYQVIQQGGARSEPWLIELIAAPDGRIVYRHDENPPRKVYDARLNGEMVRMMQGVIEHGTGKRAAIDRPAAGKTGTSQEGRDAWFVGFTPDLAAGVWIGDDRGRPMKDMGGGDLPAETWARFMLAAEDSLPAQSFSFSAANQVEDARAEFYGALADDLDRAAHGQDVGGPPVAESAPATPSPATPNPATSAPASP